MQGLCTSCPRGLGLAAGSTHTGGVLVNSRWFASPSERTTGTRQAQTRTPARGAGTYLHPALTIEPAHLRRAGLWCVVSGGALACAREPPAIHQHTSGVPKALVIEIEPSPTGAADFRCKAVRAITRG